MEQPADTANWRHAISPVDMVGLDGIVVEETRLQSYLRRPPRPMLRVRCGRY